MIRSFHSLPPAESLDGMPDLKGIIEEYQATLGEWRGCNAEYEGLKTALDDARRADEEAAIKAYREGKAHPGNKREKKVKEQMEEVLQRQKVREGALGKHRAGCIECRSESPR